MDVLLPRTTPTTGLAPRVMSESEAEWSSFASLRARTSSSAAASQRRIRTVPVAVSITGPAYDCTFLHTKDRGTSQCMVRCLTCFGSDATKVVCMQCLNHCHFGHATTVVQWVTGSCDCGRARRCRSTNPFWSATQPFRSLHQESLHGLDAGKRSALAPPGSGTVASGADAHAADPASANGDRASWSRADSPVPSLSSSREQTEALPPVLSRAVPGAGPQHLEDGSERGSHALGTRPLRFRQLLLRSLATHVPRTSIGQSLLHSPWTVYHTLATLALGATHEASLELQHLLRHADKKELFQQLSTDALWVKALRGIVYHSWFVLSPACEPSPHFMTCTKGLGTTFLPWSGRVGDINQAVSQFTGGMVSHLLQPNDVAPNLQFLIVTVVYLKLPWVKAFDPACTRAAPFRSCVPMTRSSASAPLLATAATTAGSFAVTGVSDRSGGPLSGTSEGSGPAKPGGTKVVYETVVRSVPMMRMTREVVRYHEDKENQYVELVYEHNRREWVMGLVKPHVCQPVHLLSFHVPDTGAFRSVRLSCVAIPKCKRVFRGSLRGVLHTLGLAACFQPAAAAAAATSTVSSGATASARPTTTTTGVHFGDMTVVDVGLHDVIHMCGIDLQESGTESPSRPLGGSSVGPAPLTDPAGSTPGSAATVPPVAELCDPAFVMDAPGWIYVRHLPSGTVLFQDVLE